MSERPPDVPADLVAGLDGDRFHARRALVRDLLGQGFSLDEIRAADRGHRLPLLPVERVLRGTPTLTTHDLVERTGIDPELLERALQAAGLPIPEHHERIWEERDLALPALLQSLVGAGIGTEPIVELSRTLGEAAARMGAAAIVGVGSGLNREGDTEHDLATRATELIRPVNDHLADAVGLLVRAHAIDQLAATELDEDQIADGQIAGSRPVTIGFADVVGFTRMGEQLGAQRLQDVAARLGELAGEVSDGSVRFVKTIGDAVMVSGTRPADVVTAMLRLQERVADDPGFPRIRAGVATGDAVPRAGDWFGPAVNRAARVCATARPGSVLVDDATRVRTDDEALHWTTIGGVRLKGLGRVLVHRARRGGAGGHAGGGETREPRHAPHRDR